MTFYEDVALEALAIRDESAAREFVADALGGINGDDARSVGLRETLSAYIQTGQNAASTAAALRQHEATTGRGRRSLPRLQGMQDATESVWRNPAPADPVRQRGPASDPF
jgi:hypothetical protein